MAVSVIEGNYFQDLLDQPRALADTIAGLEDSPALQSLAQQLGAGEFERVVLTGMGSSLHALYPLLLDLTEFGLTAMLVETSELVHYYARLLSPSTLVIAVSQSGRSAETLRLLELNARRCRLVAVTNTPDSPLAEQANLVVLTRCGPEFSISSKTYVSTLAALAWLGNIVCQRDLDDTRSQMEAIPAAVSGYLGSWRQHVCDVVDVMTGVTDVFLAGRGSSLATTGAGGLIIKESTHFHSEGLSAAAFRHGPFEMLSDKVFVLVFAGDERTAELNLRLSQDVIASGGRSAVVSEVAELGVFQIPEAPLRLRPIVEFLPVEMITLGLAALAGREAGKFELASKITAIE